MLRKPQIKSVHLLVLCTRYHNICTRTFLLGAHSFFLRNYELGFQKVLELSFSMIYFILDNLQLFVVVAYAFPLAWCDSFAPLYQSCSPWSLSSLFILISFVPERSLNDLVLQGRFYLATTSGHHQQVEETYSCIRIAPSTELDKARHDRQVKNEAIVVMGLYIRNMHTYITEIVRAVSDTQGPHNLD